MHNLSDFQTLNMIQNSTFKRAETNNLILDLTRIKKEKIDCETKQSFAKKLPLNNLKYSKPNQQESFSPTFKPSFNYSKKAIKQKTQNVSHLPSESIDENHQNIPNCLSSLQLDLLNKQHFQIDSAVNFESSLIYNQTNEAVPKSSMINLNQCKFPIKPIPLEYSWSESQDIALFNNAIYNQEQFLKLPLNLNIAKRDNQENTFSSFLNYENQLETLEARSQNIASAFNSIYDEKLNEISRNRDQNFQNSFISYLNYTNQPVDSQVPLNSNTLNNREMSNFNFETELLSRLNAFYLKGKQSQINPTQIFQNNFHRSLNTLSNKQDTQFNSEMPFWLNINKHSMSQMLSLQNNELIESPNYTIYNANNQKQKVISKFQNLDFQLKEMNFPNNLRNSFLSFGDRLDSQVPLKSNIEPVINSNHDAIPYLYLELNHANHTNDIIQPVPDIKPNIDNRLEISNLNEQVSIGNKKKPNEDSMNIIAKKMKKFPIEQIKISGFKKKSEILHKRAKTLFKKANEVAMKCNCKIVVIIKNQRNYTQHCTLNEMETKITNIIETHV